MSLRGFGVLAWALAAVGCTGEISSEVAAWEQAPQALVLDAPEWNAGAVDLGKISAVVEDGDAVLVFGEQGATRLSGGAVSGQDSSVTAWRAAARIPAADGAGHWVVGVDDQGQLYRMRGSNRLEPISERYGLGDDAVVDLAPLAAAGVVFGLEQRLVVADGEFVTRYDVAAVGGVAAAFEASTGLQRVAAIGKGGSVSVLELKNRALSSVDLSGVTASSFFRGQLLFATDSTLYELRDEQLIVVYEARDKLHGLVVSAEQLWLADGDRLCVRNELQFACSPSAAVARDARLAASLAGDVWELHAGTLARHALAATGDEAVWRKQVVSVYARVCSSCHAPGGSSGIDLSSYAAWRTRKDKVDKRVLVDKNMPPDRALADADREAIAAWLQAK